MSEIVYKRKKIVILHHCDGLGGAGVSLLNIHSMLEDNYDIKTYLPHKDSQLETYFRKHGVEVHTINDPVGMISSYSGGPKIFSRTFIKKLLEINQTTKLFQKIIDWENPDIVAVNSMTLAWAGKIIKKNNCKSICFVRETFINNLGMKYIKYFLDRYFDMVIYISNYDKIKMNCKAPILGVVNDCISRENYIIDITRAEACNRLNIKEGTFNILFVGGNNELKGWSIIVSSMEKLIDYDINLVVAGSDSGNDNIDHLNIEFIGKRIDMPEVYRACDVLVFPSISPHQARPAFEAGIMGLPVIMSDFEETREHVQDGINALTFIPCDSDDLAKKIIRLYEDRELCKKLGKENHKHSLQFHAFESCKKKLLDLLRKL